MNKQLTHWLVNRVNCKTKSLEIDGKCIPIKLFLKHILGLPSDGMKVQVRKHVDEVKWSAFSQNGKPKTIS